LIWADCAHWLRHPEEGLAEAQAELRARLSKAPSLDAERQRLNESLSEKEEERERVITLYRRKRMTLEEAERDLDTIQHEAGQLRAMLDAIRAQDDLTRAFEAQYTEAATMLAALGQEVDEIEETNDLVRKRRVIEMLVAGIRVKPQGRGIDGRVSVTYRFGRPHAPVISLTNAKNARLRSVVSPQLTGTSW